MPDPILDFSHERLSLAALLTRPTAPFVLVFLLAMTLFTAYNRFPFFYSADEKVKIDFVRGEVNALNHPLLLMGTSRVAAQVFRAKSRESMVWTGRIISALFAAGAVLALMGVAAMLGGPSAAWAVGLIGATSPLLLVRAHYMKEDTALVLGLALTALAATAYLRRSSARGVLLLGAACAGAASGKYVGIVVLPFALPLIWFMLPQDRPWERKRVLIKFFAAFLLTAAVINNHYLRHGRDFVQGLAFELNHVSTGHHGLTPDSVLAKLVRSYFREIPWSTHVLAFLYLCLFIPTWRRRRSAEWMMFLFPILYFIMLSFSRIQFARYLLPVTVWIHYLAGMGLAEGLRRLPLKARPRHALLASALVIVVLWQGAFCLGALAQFADDGRERLARWTATHLPRQAVVLEDRYTRLSTFKGWKNFHAEMPFEVKNMKWAAEIGSLEEARRQGITHIAVCSYSYGRFFSPNVKAVGGEEQHLDEFKAFYERLFREGELIWRSASGMKPDVCLFRLLPPGTPTRPTPLVQTDQAEVEDESGQ